MPENLPDDATIGKLIRQSKKAPINFAFGLGKGPKPLNLTVDKKKPGKSLFAALKKDGEDISKGAWGTLQLDGKEVTFTCEKPMPGLEKALKFCFKQKGLKFKPIVAKGK